MKTQTGLDVRTLRSVAWENDHELVAWGMWGLISQISKRVGKLSINKCLIKYLHSVMLCSPC